MHALLRERMEDKILTTPKKPTSGADIIVPATLPKVSTKALKSASSPIINNDEIFDKLYRLHGEFGKNTNKNHQALKLIAECISQGGNTRKSIICLISGLGLSSKHIAIILDRGTGTNPNLYEWCRDESGLYKLIN